MNAFFTACFVFLLHAVNACTPPFESLDNGCYFYSGGLFAASYNDASQVCIKLGGYLAMIKSGDENRAVIDNYLLSDMQGERVLLGATANDANLFEWIDGNLVRDGFDAWGNNQPNGNGGCMGYSVAHDLLWEDFICENFTDSNLFVGFLCEEQLVNTTQVPTTTSTQTTTTTAALECTAPFVEVGSWCYYFVRTEVTYNEATNICAAMNAHLAYITSAEEQSAVEPYLSETGEGRYIFIGGYDIYGNDTMYWLDGTAVDSGYTNYHEDSVDGGDEDALFMDNNLDWQWGDFPPDDPQPFLCERDV